MKCIKTCYGEWVNPALVKHFGIKYKDDGSKEYWLAVADGVTLEIFEIELPPCEDNIWHEDTAENRAKQAEWHKAHDLKRRQARAKACAWLAELVAKID